MTLRPSLSATTLAMVAMVTLLATAGFSAALYVVPFCLVALLATHLVSTRLDRSSYVPLLARLVFFPAVFAINGALSVGIDWLFDQRTLFSLGQVAAIEVCLQHWKHVPSARTGTFPIASLLLSSLIFLAASNVYFQGFYIPFITPLFFGVLGWALLSWRPARVPRRAFFVICACWVGAVMAGRGLYEGSMYFKSELMNLGSNLLRNRSLPQVAGISNRPRMSSRFDIQDSPRRVLRIEGTLFDPHLRAASFSTYDGLRWGPGLSSSERVLINTKTQAQLIQQPGPKEKTSSARITQLAEIPDTPLFAPLNILSLRILNSATKTEDLVFEYEPDGGMVRSDEPVPFSYEVTESEVSIAGVPTRQGPLTSKISPEERARYLSLPEGFDPRVLQLANETTIEADTPAERVEALVRYLISNHKYSREIRVDEGREPISQFILEKKAAHCEFFAAGLALMCRGVGVPSRYVVGYLAHEAAPGQPGVTNVRQRDAHAWTEVWIDGIGWVAADATPGDGRPESREAASKPQQFGEWLSDFITNLRNRAVRIPRSTWAWIIGVPLVAWIIVRGRPQARAARARKRGDYAGAEGEAAQKLEALARDFEKHLASQKLAPDAARSWSWFLAREQREREQKWARDYEAARFGVRTEVLEADVERLERELRELREARA